MSSIFFLLFLGVLYATIRWLYITEYPRHLPFVATKHFFITFGETERNMKLLAGIVLVWLASSYTANAQNYARYSDIKAGMKNLHLEHDAVRAANKRAAAMRCRESFSDAVIVSEAWEKEGRCDGQLMGRYIHMELYGETPDGRCGVAHCVFGQKVLADDTYSPKLHVVEIGTFYHLECE
jgi:hypothetical protein